MDHSSDSPGGRPGRASGRAAKCCLGLLLLAGLLGGGCAPRYRINLGNNNELITRGKPRLDKETDTVRFKTIDGRQGELPAFRIRSIEPY